MAGRVGTVYGTGGADFIDPDYVDAEGNSIFKFEDDNGYTWSPDVIHIWAGDGDDTIRFYDRGVNLHPTYVDQLIIHAGAGNDNISFQGNWYSWNPRAPIGVNAGEGDDVVTVQTPGHTSPPWITLGTGSDELRVSSFSNETGVVMVTDYAPGEDRLTYQHTSAQWIEITPENLGVQRGLDGYYEANDTADGLVVTAYHVRDIRHPDGTTTWQYYPSCEIVLQGVTREEFVNGAAGNGQIEGTAGRDVIRNDYVDAGGDAIAAAGNIILAGAGNDLINLTVDDSEVSCGDGRDVVIVRGSDNTVTGEGGDDYLIARQGGSVLDGGAGDDRLVADIRQGGNHVLTGGEGADSFAFLFGATRHAAAAEITDFDLGLDRLSVDGAQIDLSALPAGMLAGTDSDGSVILSVGLNDTVTLRGVTEADLGLILI